MKRKAKQKQIVELKQTLTNHKHRITRSRLDVADILISQSRSSMTPEEIHQEILDSREYSSYLTSVYRALTLFESLGFVERTDFYGEAAQYRWKTELPSEESSHKHYFKCNHCYEVEPLTFCVFTELAPALIKLGYADLDHRFEVRGTCPKCRSSL